MTYRVVFMGTPEFAIPPLKALLNDPNFQVVAAITQPDRPAGRGNKLQSSPVKELALEYGIEVFQPERLRGDEILQKLRDWQPDFQVVAAFGQILRQAVLDIPQYGSINVHASLLPRWRGAAPIQASILAGDKVTGITIMQMDAGLDTGPMLTQTEVQITGHDTGESLHDKLALAGGPLLIKTLKGVASGEILPQIQDDTLSTYAPRIKKEDGKIDWTSPAVNIDRLVRAYYPWPAAFSMWNNQLLKILSGYPLANNPQKLPVGVVSLEDKDAPLVIGTGEGRYAVKRLQVAGRNVANAEDFVNGSPHIHAAQLD